MIAIIAAGIGGLFPAGEGKSEPVDSYEWKGETMYIYDDPLPLEVEDLADADLLWSREARLQESPLLAYGEYSQDIPLTGERSNYELRYSICDVKFAPLRGFIRERLIASRQDVVQDGEVVFVEHFEPVDPEPFGADEAWRLLWDDGTVYRPVSGLDSRCEAACSRTETPASVAFGSGIAGGYSGH